MTISRPCYATRRDVVTATDTPLTGYDAQIDSAIEAASEDIDRLTARRFYTALETMKYDWPNFQRAYPWRIWFDAAELADVTSTVPVVTVTGTGVIPAGAVFWGPSNYAPPFTYLELDRSQSYAFGGGPTPQRNVSVQGLRGYWTRTRPAGLLAAAITDTTGTQVTVTDSTLAAPGDVLTVDTEKLLVTDQRFADTTIAFAGPLSDSAAENTVDVPDGTKFSVGEVLRLDTEQMLITDIIADSLVTERAYAGTTLAQHTSGTIWAARQLTVARGQLGTTAATHSNAAPLTAALVPGQVRELAIAEALNYVFQKTSGYARTIGENGASTVPGGSLPDLRTRVWEKYGRRARQRVV